MLIILDLREPVNHGRHDQLDPRRLLSTPQNCLTSDVCGVEVSKTWVDLASSVILDLDRLRDSDWLRGLDNFEDSSTCIK